MSSPPTPPVRHQIDPTLCGREPIHIPGAIQPRGALLAARASDLVVTHASANLEAILGTPATLALGTPLQTTLGNVAWLMIVDDVQAGLLRDATSGGQGNGQIPDPSHVYTTARLDRDNLMLRVFRSGRHVCVEIEPIHPELMPGPRDSFLRSVLETFAHATTSTELCEFAVHGLAAITRFDRVVAYRLGTDGHGEIIAESREPQLEPYLGLQYPANDIPPQARALFLRQRTCVIDDTRYKPVPLLVDPASDDGTPLDLTLSLLRSVSPVHRQYLQNMNVTTSLCTALVQWEETDQERLWGMLACHSVEQRAVGPDLLAAFKTVGQVVSLMLRSLDEAEMYSERLTRNDHLRPLVDWIADPRPLSPEGLAGKENGLLRLVNANGALVRVSGIVRTFGRLPPLPAAERALQTLLRTASGSVLAVDDLALRHHELADCTVDGSGALLMPLPQTEGDAILWFRPERIRTVTWAGNPHEHVTADPVTGRLSPRGSFAAWKEIESGRSVPWRPGDLAIVRKLRLAVEAAVAVRTKIELARLRFYDPLTALPNRSLLEERLRDLALATVRKNALLFLDLDGFKTINDTMGHGAGDTLLVEVARRLVTAVGPDQLVVRLGGDEFVVLCPSMDQPSAIALGERIRLAIASPFEVSGRPCHISSSIGVATTDQAAGVDLVRAADMAMYAAKQAGGNRYVLFEPWLLDRASKRFELEQDMREALATDDQFVLLYQPLFTIATGDRRLRGFEALVRWRHPRNGWMSPTLFIPLAEKSGLILPLGERVLAMALRHGSALRQAHPSANLIINVNVSALQLPQPGFKDGVAGALEAEGMPPAALCLEITESMLTDGAAAAVLADIRALGVKVAIDDFGIGYSSLSYLRRLPVDKVKLDRSFLEGVDGDPHGIAFVGAVIALAHAAGKPVVFEGIETKAQFDIALATGADIVQGFFLAPPLSANAALDLVVQHQRLEAQSNVIRNE